MGFRINTNIQAISAQRNLQNIRREQDKSLERLSSGERIVRAGDDAAGLSISENLKSEIRSGMQAERNAGDGISLIQTAEGGLNEISSLLIRLKELSVQTASDTIGDQERAYSDNEFGHLISEIERIAQSTEFNGRSLLNGEQGELEFQIGTRNTLEADRILFTTEESVATADAIGISGMSVATKEDAQSNLDTIGEALNVINSNRSKLGAIQNRLQSTINNLSIKNENLAAAKSRIRDTDVATEAANLTKSNILAASGTSVLAQANVTSQAALKLVA